MLKNILLKAGLIAVSTSIAAQFAIGAVQAGEKLSKADIEKLMSGNSINGVFGKDNQAYRQNNHSDGYLVVHLKGDKILTIPWFAKEEGGVGMYCEDWKVVGWDTYCFTAERKSDTEIAFTRPSGDINTATWTEGFIDLNY